MTKLVLPELGENIESVDVSAVLVAKGDNILRDQPVIEVETEKASLEVPATAGGRVAELLVQAGDTVKVGQVILVIEHDAAVDAADAPSVGGPEPQAAPPFDSTLPAAAPVIEFPVHTGAAIVEQPVATVARPPTGDPAPAAPSVRRLARELGIDIHQVPGSGRAGRISRDDVKAWAKRLLAGAAVVGGGAPARPLPDFTQWGLVEREPLGKVRRITAESMGHAWATIPHVTQFDRADVSRLDAMRKDFNRRPEAAEAKLTMTALIVKLAAAALRQFPRFNASLDLAAAELIRKQYVHIGVAVDTDRGLLVPVIRDVDKKGLLDVARELNDLAARARSKKVKPDEMAGATFTISNLGGLGTTYFSPIVNWPEVAILGVGRAEVQAVHEDGQFVPRLLLPLSVSYDHRVIDGADAARFLRWLAEALEQPLLLLLENHGR